jgi:uncharacterized membrane protein YqaE (UPF0057 family)
MPNCAATARKTPPSQQASACTIAALIPDDTCQSMPATEAFPRRHLTLAFAILMPFLALALQHGLWTTIQPLAFVTFYPALVISSWIGGRSGGPIALILSIVHGSSHSH